MKCTFVISCVFLVLIPHVLSLSYQRPLQKQNSSEISLSVSSSNESSDFSDDSDEFLEELEGPEENPKCEQSSEWPRMYPTCAGLRQSPINIKVSNIEKTGYVPVLPLCWENYDSIPISTNLYNAGHTIQMTGKWPEDKIPTISCGILGEAKYQFVQWHCHWAKNNFNGSDHTFNGKPFPMECHFVHFRKDFGSFEKAALQQDGIAVVAYLYDIGSEDTFPVDVMGRAMLRLVKQDNVSVMPLPLAVYVPTFLDNYVTYQGSLTTPPCSESVIWIIHIRAQKISKSLIKKFRCVAQASECLNNNFRAVQEINGRDIILVPDRQLLD